jgi:hypothetical protein
MQGEDSASTVEEDTKLLELSVEGTNLLELFASNFVPGGRGSR